MESTPRASLSDREREHLEVAESFGNSWFSATEFKDKYEKMFPGRPRGSMIPSDYCVGHEVIGNETFPRFLIRKGRSQYRLATELHSSVKEREGTKFHRYPVGSKVTPRERSSVSLMHRTTGQLRKRPWVLDRNEAERCLRAYNCNPIVLKQEQKVFRVTARGLERDQIGDQLRTLNAAYSVRSSLSDLDIVAQALRSDWLNWSHLLSRLRPLSESEPDSKSTSSLLSYFLEQRTARKPRSLATKALHFAAPQTFAIGDSVACNYLAYELGSEPWDTTSGLGATAMANWWCAYMRTLRGIAADNSEVIAHLLQVDRATATLLGFDRVRGVPKILDKVLWWAGKESSARKRIRLFQRN